MDMCYDGALVLPSSYAVMDEEEMCYTEGGRVVTINRKTIRSAFAMVVGAVSTCISVRGIAKWVVKSAPTIARTVLGWGPMAQAGVAILAGFIVASAIAVAIVYASNTSIRFRIYRSIDSMSHTLCDHIFLCVAYFTNFREQR